ncbi:MAG: ABC transporter ATP-binding protein [Candidatus Woesearchaeota archaeon]
MVIEVKDLCRSFRVPKRKQGLKEAIKSLFKREFVTKQAVKDVTFRIREGEIVGLLGPNGAGKSTAIKMMTGILSVSSGEITALGMNPFTQRKEYVKNIGALFGQKSQLWWDIPALDSYELSKTLYDIPEEEFITRRDDLIARLGVEEEVQRPVRNLSLGERMKCEFVMAVLHRPKILFLDEPTIGLDVFAKEQIREFIKYINNEFNTTIILTTHDMDDIEHLARRVIVINHGEKVFDDTLTALRSIAGAKKRIRVVTQKQLPKLDKAGIHQVQRISEYEATLNLDASEMSIQSFVEHVTTNNTIIDLEVTSPTVEEIIKVLY